MYYYLKKRLLRAQSQAACFSQECNREESQPPPQNGNQNLLSQGHTRGAQPPSQHQNVNIFSQGHIRGAQPSSQHQNANIFLQGHMRGAQLPSQYQNLNMLLQGLTRGAQPPPQYQNLNIFSQGQTRQVAQLPPQYRNQNLPSQRQTREAAQPPPQCRNQNILSQGHMRGAQPPSQYQNPNILSQGQTREAAQPPSQYQYQNLRSQGHKKEEAQLPSQTQNSNLLSQGHKKEEEAQDTIQNSNLPTLQNVVSTANVCCKLNLKELALKARNAEYNPRRFSAMIMRMKEPKTTALIFESGKVVVTGAKSEELSKIACRKFARILQKLGAENGFKDFKIQNVVASFDCGFPVGLESLSVAHHKFCSYEPELFPGLIYRMKKPKIVILIFNSGKMVLTGGKTRKELYEAFENIHPVCMEFRRPRRS